ncbi:homoserine kinase [Lactobacillaceae bacterium L1_55_11]|nr:homoserine kinase [Lactobacillaceae bacterium L1_55_11]
MLKIKVPATSANLGPGFDSLGVALSRYLTLTVLDASDDWQIDHPFGTDVPTDGDNYIIKVAKQLAPNLTPHQLHISSDIPFARGLGSSSAAILAGLALANELADLGLNDDQILLKATELEGHPDNVAPALFGGAVAAYYDGSQVAHAPITIPDSLRVLTYIPPYAVKTADARAALPQEMDFKQAVKASAISNVLVASFNSNKLDQALTLVGQDQFHEAARAHLVPELGQIRQIAHDLGFQGTYLSGAGPTVATMLPEGGVAQLESGLAPLKLPGELVALTIDQWGLTVTTD